MAQYMMREPAAVPLVVDLGHGKSWEEAHG